jgi:hypothetical protein
LRLAFGLVVGLSARAQAQVQIRLDDPTRTWYSELHEGLRDGTPAADSVRRVLTERRPARLWRLARRALAGKASWNDAALAFTRLAELRDPASADSARRWLERIQDGSLAVSGDFDPGYLVAPLRAILLEYSRERRSDLDLLNDFLARIPSGRYNLADAWVFGRLGMGAADSVARRFLETSDRDLRIRYLTLLSFCTDTALIPLLERIYAAPDSFGLPPRIGVRASDGLLWIGTRQAVEALLRARQVARTRGVYADPRLGGNDLDFLANDSASVVARTGRWLTEWLATLR